MGLRIKNRGSGSIQFIRELSLGKMAKDLQLRIALNALEEIDNEISQNAIKEIEKWEDVDVRLTSEGLEICTDCPSLYGKRDSCYVWDYYEHSIRGILREKRCKKYPDCPINPYKEDIPDCGILCD